MEDQETFKKVINRDNFWLWCKVDWKRSKHTHS